VQGNLDPIQRIDPGNGRIVVQNMVSRGHVFSELSSSYPLKLLSPRIARDRLAIVYIITYGGGLVGGDIISLSIDVGPGSSLVLLSQVRIFRSAYTTQM
jgi:urease accessory protein